MRVTTKGYVLTSYGVKEKHGFMLYPDKTCKNKEKSRKKQK
jgi:hypothetical protein